MAEELTSLMANIAGGDLVAIDAKYCYNCFNRGLVRRRESDKPLQARVFAELVSYIEISYIESSVENGNCVLKLSLIIFLRQAKIFLAF